MKKNNADVITKMMVIGIGSLAVILVLASIYVAMTTSGNKSKNSKSSSQQTTTVTKTTKAKDEIIKYNRTIALVKHSDMDTKKMVVYDINEGKGITFDVESDTELKDAYGTDIALSQFRKGDIVDVKYNAKDKSPEYIRITATAWERKGITDLVVNEEAKTIKVKNDVYKFTDELVLLDAGQPFDLDSLSKNDKVDLRGYKDTVWAIEVSGRHGSVKLQNYEIFIGGTLDIVGKVSKDVVANMIIPLPAGEYSISLSKENVPPVVKKVEVVAGQETVLDFSDVKAKVGEVEFVLEQEGAKIFIDDKRVNLKEKTILDFGNYKIKATMDGFEDWKGDLLVNQAYLRYKIDFGQKQHYIFFNEPEGAEVYFDGLLVGVIPTKVPFTGGSHKVQLRQDGYRTSESYNYLWGDEKKDQYLILPDLIPLITTTESESTTESTSVSTVTSDAYDNTSESSSEVTTVTEAAQTSTEGSTQSNEDN